MIAFPRRVARRFRAACARCTSGRPRGPAPCVVIRQADGRVTLTATFPEVTLELNCAAPPARGRAEVLVVPLTALETVGANSDESVEFDAGEGLSGVARWVAPGGPGSVPVTFVLPGKQHDSLPRPEMKPVPAGLLAALHEAGRTSSREDGRYALSRVQVRGATGQVVATDGKLAVVFGPFAFPFTGDVLVPAVPLFGSPEVRTERDVRVGRTDAHLALSAGDWTAWLGVAPAGKFPDVVAVVPRHAPTTVTLDRGDAADLLPQLPGLPGQGHDLRPVTLCADGALTVRAGDDTGTVKEVRLARSPVAGPAARVALDRRALARILALGCTALRVTPGKALVGTGDGVTVLAALLDPELAVAPEPRAPGPDAGVPIPNLNSNPKRNTTVKPNDTNGPAHGSRHDPPAETPDPLIAAEELRAALADAATKAARLVAALKASKKEQKVLATVLTNLKQLNLGTGGPR